MGLRKYWRKLIVIYLAIGNNKCAGKGELISVIPAWITAIGQHCGPKLARGVRERMPKRIELSCVCVFVCVERWRCTWLLWYCIFFSLFLFLFCFLFQLNFALKQTSLSLSITLLLLLSRQRYKDWYRYQWIDVRLCMYVFFYMYICMYVCSI